METRKPDDVKTAAVIVKLKEKGCRDDVLKLAKEDLELGYPKELVALYAEAGWQMDRCKKFSSIMRGNSDEELLRLLADGAFNQYQMQLLANYYDKGVPAAQLRDVGAKNLTAYDMEQALKMVYQANRETETDKEKVKETESPEDNNLQEKIASLTVALDQREKELGDQQEINNRQAAESADLRTKAESLEKQVRELEQEKAGHDSEKRSILEERDRFYRQNQALLQEKEQLIADLEEVQKEKDGMEQRLKEMGGTAMQTAAEQTVAARDTAGEQQPAGRQQAAGIGQKIPEQQGTGSENSGDGDMENNDFLVSIKGRNGERHLVPVERSMRRKPDRLKVFAEKIFGRGRQGSGLIKQLTGKGLNPAQMEQVRMAIQAGLVEQEINDLIDSGFSAEEMAQAIEIVVAERAYQ